MKGINTVDVSRFFLKKKTSNLGLVITDLIRILINLKLIFLSPLKDSIVSTTSFTDDPVLIDARTVNIILKRHDSYFCVFEQFLKL